MITSTFGIIHTIQTSTLNNGLCNDYRHIQQRRKVKERKDKSGKEGKETFRVAPCGRWLPLPHSRQLVWRVVPKTPTSVGQANIHTQ